MNYPTFYQCLDCGQVYTVEIDKCVACGADDWVTLTKKQAVAYLRLMLAKLTGAYPEKRRKA